MFRYSQKGFTLIELIVVISIISVLSTIVIASVNSSRIAARDALRVSQINEVTKALAIYYSIHERYPYGPIQAWSIEGYKIPYYWSEMMKELNTKNLLKSTFYEVGFEQSDKYSLNFFKSTYAAVIDSYYGCSIQDPLYLVFNDYDNSYGYIVSDDYKSYKLRVRMENKNHPIFSKGVTGSFIDSNTTGLTACDKTEKYVCLTSVL